MRFVFIVVLISSISLFLSNISRAAGFDCAKATTEVERMICLNPELSKLDEKMAMVYSAVIARATAPKYKGETMYSAGLNINATIEQIRSQQRNWLINRNKCRDVTCLSSTYNSQIKTLNAAIHIPQHNNSDPASDDLRFLGIRCDENEKELEVGYVTSYNNPYSSSESWNIFHLKTNSNPDDRGNQHVLAVHEVVRECSFDSSHYNVTISAEPGGWSLTGPCGGIDFGHVVILRNNVKIIDEILGGCFSEEIVTKIRITEDGTGPLVNRILSKND